MQDAAVVSPPLLPTTLPLVDDIADWASVQTPT